MATRVWLAPLSGRVFIDCKGETYTFDEASGLQKTDLEREEWIDRDFEEARGSKVFTWYLEREVYPFTEVLRKARLMHASTSAISCFLESLNLDNDPWMREEFMRKAEKHLQNDAVFMSASAVFGWCEKPPNIDLALGIEVGRVGALLSILRARFGN